MLERVCVNQDSSVRVRGPSPLHRQARMHLHHQLSSATWCCCPSPSYRPPYLSAAKRIFFGERTSSSWTHLQSSLRTFRLQPSPNNVVVLKVHPPPEASRGRVLENVRGGPLEARAANIDTAGSTSSGVSPMSSVTAQPPAGRHTMVAAFAPVQPCYQDVRCVEWAGSPSLIWRLRKGSGTASISSWQGCGS